MAKSRNDELFQLLRERGLRKKLAKSIAALDGNSRRAGAKGEKLARKTAEDLNLAAEDIRKRILRSDPTRTRGARKAAGMWARKASKRTASARKPHRHAPRTARELERKPVLARADHVAGGPTARSQCRLAKYFL